MHLNQKPVILFDWDGTLADSMTLCVEGVRGALNKLGLPAVPEEKMRACNGPTYDETLEILNIPPEMAMDYKRVRRDEELCICGEVNRLFPGIREMLLRLAQHAHLCVASNGGADYLALCCRIFDLEGVFARMEAFQTGRSKAQAIDEILQAMQPSRAIMVGDRLGDISAGRDNGLPTVCCTYGYGTADEWAQADHAVASVEELEALLTAFALQGA